MTRTDPATFDLPVEKIRSGYYSDQYFNYTKALLEEQETWRNRPVLMQIFQKKEAVLGGIDEAIAVLKECNGHTFPCGACEGRKQVDSWDGGSYRGQIRCGFCDGTGNMWRNGWDKLKVWALNEGDEISPFEPVMWIEGPYSLFAHLETVYLGTLARRTMIGTNVKRVIKAANGKPIWYFPARHDHWTVQTGDGFAAHRAGVAGVSSDAQANWWGGKGMGTVPHALIAAFKGHTELAAAAFARKYGDEMNISVLVDFDNDCARTAVATAEYLKEEGLPLWGVRLDTSESLVDRGLWDSMGQFKPTGVNPELVRHVRVALDLAGHEDVKIICSGGFTAEKIECFEGDGVPVDAYGVGASLIHGDYAFTADIVAVNHEPCAKVGRKLIPSSRLQVVN